MKMLLDTSKRSEEVEIMDDFSVDGPMLRKTLDSLDLINKWLGGTGVTLVGLKKVLDKQSKDKLYTIMDLGCGSGELLRKVADFGRSNGFKFKLIGIDANLNTIQYARELSLKYDNIEFHQCDILSKEFSEYQYDLVLSSLFLHHFTYRQLVDLLTLILDNASIGIVVNDLHRHRIAYYLFKMISIPISNRMVREDGLTSVLKGFKRRDLEKLTQEVQVSAEISWKWAFRYLWILKKDQ
jgi:2-polyprenyl-3-methyl-5-hydroxy-6-metoxy-1,4-benzoquinol methylase